MHINYLFFQPRVPVDAITPIPGASPGLRSLDSDSEPSSSGSPSSEDGAWAGDLRRKYENISRAVAEDPMYFYDDIFSIEPVEGRVWAKSTFTVTVTFAPR